jgi:uncharacterized protein (TIRG00374 family)
MKPALDQKGVLGLLHRSEYYSLIIVAVTIAAFSLLAVATDSRGVVDALERMGPLTTISVMILASCNYACRIVRFRYLLSRRGLDVPFPSLVEIYLAGGAMAVTPGKVGEFIRGWMLRTRHNLPYRKTLPVLIADRAGDVIASVLLGLLSLHAFTGYAVAAAAISAVFLAGCALLMWPALLIRLIGWAYGLLRVKPRLFVMLRQIVRNTSDLFKPAPFFISLVISCAGWIMECLALYFCAVSFAPDFAIEQAIFIFTFASLLGAISLIPGGVGGTEALMGVLLTTVGLTVGQAAAVTLTIRVGTLWFGVACGYVALFSFLSARRAAAKIAG